MLKKFINKELKKVESDKCMKAIEMRMLDFLTDFDLEGNNLALTYRNYKKIDIMINASDLALKKWDTFRLLVGRINVEDLDEEMDKIWYKYILKENELDAYLLDNKELGATVREINDIADKLFKELQDSNITLSWRNKYFRTFELLSLQYDTDNIDEYLLDMIRDFKVPSLDFESIWYANKPSSDFIDSWTDKITSGEDNVNAEDVFYIQDTVLDIMALVVQTIIIHFFEEK